LITSSAAEEGVKPYVSAVSFTTAILNHINPRILFGGSHSMTTRLAITMGHGFPKIANSGNA
jgi:hypothetical protein